MAVVGCNEKGYAVGGSHHNAVLTDLEVEQLRRLHAEKGYGWRRLARMFGISGSTVKHILDGSNRRAPRKWLRVDRPRR